MNHTAYMYILYLRIRKALVLSFLTGLVISEIHLNCNRLFLKPGEYPESTSWMYRTSDHVRSSSLNQKMTKFLLLGRFLSCALCTCSLSGDRRHRRIRRFSTVLCKPESTSQESKAKNKVKAGPANLHLSLLSCRNTPTVLRE